MIQRRVLPPQMYITPKYGGVIPRVAPQAAIKVPDRSTSAKRETRNTSVEKRRLSQHRDSYDQIQFRDRVNLNELIGKGKFSNVYKVIHSDQVFALKVISKQIVSRYKLQVQIQREIQIQLSLRHINSVKMFGHYQDDENFYIILEYCHQGDLVKYVKDHPLNESQIVNISKQLLRVTEHMHRQGVTHRDIKPDNIFMSFDLLKLGDYGCAASCRERRTTFCGTLDYMSPEVITGGGQVGVRYKGYDERADIWSIGVVVYWLSCGDVPFKHQEEQLQMDSICKDDTYTTNGFTPMLVDFIGKCLQKSPNKRSTLAGLLMHPWCQQYDLN